MIKWTTIRNIGNLYLQITYLLDITTAIVVSFYQRTPLHLAAREGRDDTVECLVDQGADICVTDNHGVQNVTTDDII